MIKTLKKTIFYNWNFIRWFRLAIGLIIAYQALEVHNGLLGVLAVLFIFQALANTGCCGAGGCSVKTTSRSDAELVNVKFEEIKGD